MYLPDSISKLSAILYVQYCDVSLLFLSFACPGQGRILFITPFEFIYNFTENEISIEFKFLRENFNQRSSL